MRSCIYLALSRAGVKSGERDLLGHLLKGGVCVAVAAAGFYLQPAHAAMACRNSDQAPAAKVPDRQQHLLAADVR